MAEGRAETIGFHHHGRVVGVHLFCHDGCVVIPGGTGCQFVEPIQLGGVECTHPVDDRPCCGGEVDLAQLGVKRRHLVAVHTGPVSHDNVVTVFVRLMQFVVCGRAVDGPRSFHVLLEGEAGVHRRDRRTRRRHTRRTRRAWRISAAARKAGRKCDTDHSDADLAENTSHRWPPSRSSPRRVSQTETAVS